MLRNKPNGFRNRNPIRAVVVPAAVGRFSLILCVGLLFSAGASARGYSAAVTPAGATFGIKFASNGTPLATIGGVTGAVGVSQAVSIALPGAVLPVVASAAISGAQVAGAWGAAAAVLGTAALYAIPAIKGYMDSKAITPAPGGGSQQGDSALCTVAPCYEWPLQSGGWTAKVDTACTSWMNYAQNYGESKTCTVIPVSEGVVKFEVKFTYGGSPDSQMSDNKYGRSTAPVSGGTSGPITSSAAVASLSSASFGVPLVQALVDLGFPPETTQKTTTGPPSVFKGNVVSLGLDGSVQEILSRYYVSYEDMTGGLSWNVRDVTTVTPPTVTTGVTKTTSTLANGNTSTKTTTTTTTTPNASPGSGIVTTPKVEVTEQTVVTGPDGKVVTDTTVKTGTPATVTPPVTTPTVETPKEEAKDPCLTNPLRVGCLDVDSPTGEIPKESKTITFSEESVFGSGSCPANLTAAVGLLGKTVTVWDWQKTCELALPLRAIVLALASFAAFLIVMPGENRT